MTFKRWFWTKVRGPLCDAGTAGGATGCCKASGYVTVAHPTGWTRGFRWCPEHKPEALRAIGLERPGAAEGSGR